MARKPPRGKNRDNARRSKKKVSILNTDGIKYVDWKDVDLLRRFMSDRAKIRARRVTGNNTQQQREIAQAIKVARTMALLPYTSRVTQQRGGRRGDRDRDRDGGSSGPPPVPNAPPPTRGAEDEQPGDTAPTDESPQAAETTTETPQAPETPTEAPAEAVTGSDGETQS